MPLRLPAKGGADFEKVPVGTHVAICNLIVDVGMQPGNPQFAGLVGKDGKKDSRGEPSPKIFFRFEVPSKRMSYTKDGVDHEGPMTIYANFRASLNKKANLRKVIESWRGKKFSNDGEAEQFDVFSMLGKACMILVTHSDDGKYANVDNVIALPDGVPVPKAENPLLKYTTDEDAAYNSLPKFLQEKIDGQIHAQAAAPKGASKSSNPDDAFADAEAARQEDDGFGDDPSMIR
jgi:hypothetical protein